MIVVPQNTSQPELLNHLRSWLRAYDESTSAVEMRADSTIELDDGSQLCVDALLRIQEWAGGELRVVDDHLEGTPELIIKMVDTSRDVLDMQKKYEEKGIPESIIVDKEGTVMSDSPDNYVLHPGDESVSGAIFHGLNLNLDSFYEADLSSQLSQMQELIYCGVQADGTRKVS